HAGYAALARATAASTSSAVARGTVSSTPSVAGSRTCSVSLIGLRRRRRWRGPLAEFDVELRDRVARAGERLVRAHQPPDPDREEQSAGHQRGVVAEVPVE